MTRNTKQLLLVASLIAVAITVSSCDIGLPVVDCSSINQPDMGASSASA